MHAHTHEIPGDDLTELFPAAWLATDHINTLISSAPTGVALLRAIRNERGQIIDFQYRMANSILYALMNLLAEDVLNFPLTQLSPDVVKAGMLARLTQVIMSGQPSQQIETYHLDGAIGNYDQLYLKSGDGVLMLVQDVTFSHLTADEHRQQASLLAAIQRNDSTTDIRARLMALITGNI